MSELHLIWADGNGGAERQCGLRIGLSRDARGICFYNNQRGLYLGGRGFLRGMFQLFTLLHKRANVTLICWMYRAALIGALVKVVTMGRVPVAFEIRHGLSGRIKTSRRLMVSAVGRLSDLLGIPCTFNSFFALNNHVPFGYKRTLCSVRWNAERPMNIRLSLRGEFRRSLGIHEDAYVICSIGRDVPEKNFAAAVEAFRTGSLPANVVYLLVGQGCSQYGADRVCAIEHVDDIDLVYSSVDMVFIPSTIESLSNVLCEAISCGLPIAATRVGDAEIYAAAKGYRRIIYGGGTSLELRTLLESSHREFAVSSDAPTLNNTNDLHANN